MDRDSFDDDDNKPDSKAGKYFEFDCPECNAHNPYEDGFIVGAEVLCFYCGSNFKAAMSGSRLKMKSI